MSGVVYDPFIIKDFLLRTLIRLTLENVSQLPVDYLELTFEDSTKGYAEEILADEEASDAEKYEVEYSLVNRPVFSWSQENCWKEIAPGKESVIDVRCFGKAGWSVSVCHA